MELALIPEPRRLIRESGQFIIPNKGLITIPSEVFFSVGEKLQRIFPGHCLSITAPEINASCSICLREDSSSEGYRLHITSEGVEITASSPEGALNGARTLSQIDQQMHSTLPCLFIEDWPAFENRGIYHDVTRGRVPKREQLRNMADTLAEFKLNQLQLYIEHVFHFQQHPEIGKDASPLTPEDMLNLQTTCEDNHMELLPSLASFGHLATVLQNPAYRHMAEDRGIGQFDCPEEEIPHSLAHGWTLSPANEDTYKFLDSLYKEFLPLFRSSRFNVCCDETRDLGLGQTRALCQERGRGRVYLDHILELRKLAERYGKKIFFWADVISQHPELVSEIPDDATVLLWGYSFDWDFERIQQFTDEGVPVYGCPGTNSWKSLFPRIHEATANIHGFADAARRHGAQGLLTTDWGGGGHYNFTEYSWHGFLFAAEQSWNPDADMDTFTERFNRLFLNVYDHDCTDALNELGDISHLRFGTFYQGIWQYIFFAAPGDAVLNQERDLAFISRNGQITHEEMELDANCGAETLEQLADIKFRLFRCLDKKGADPHGVMPYWRFAVDTLRHAARKLAVLGPGGTGGKKEKDDLYEELRTLRSQFRTLWHERSRPSEINNVLGHYDRVLEGLKQK